MLSSAACKWLKLKLVTPSLMCLFAANYHLIYVRTAPIWPCSSVEQQSSVPEVVGLNPVGAIDFFSFSVWAHFLSRANAQKVLFRIFIQHFNIPHLNHYIWQNNPVAGIFHRG